MSSPSKIPFRSPRPKPSVSVVMPVAAAPLVEVSTSKSYVRVNPDMVLVRMSHLEALLSSLEHVRFPLSVVNRVGNPNARAIVDLRLLISAAPALDDFIKAISESYSQ